MRVYSKSQGKVIETGEKGQAGVGGGGGGDIGKDQFKNAMLMDLLQTGGKNLSKIKTVQDAFIGTQDKKDSTALRKEFTTETKSLGFPELQRSWQKVQSAPTTGGGDLTIIYSYIKALDPTTAVREGEINLTKAAESIPSNIIRAYKRAKSGQVVSPELRQEMIGEIGRMYNERAKKQQELNAFYSGLASDSGLDPQDVIGKVGEITFADISEAKPKQTDKSIGGTLGGILGGAGGFMVGGPAGAGLGAVAGYGAGGAAQETLQDLLKTQTEQPLEQVKKVGGGALGAGGKAFTAAQLLNLLQGAGTFLKGGGLKGIRSSRAVEAGAKGIKIEGEKVAEAALNAAEKAPTTYRPSARRIALEAIEKFSGKQISPLEAVGEKAASWKAGYTATRAGKGASAYMERAIGSEVKKQIATKAKGVAEIDKIYSTLFKAKGAAKSGLWNALKVGWLGRILGFGG